MVFTNLNIYREEDDIIIFQENAECSDDDTVYITADMVDCVCAELQKLKEQIQEGK